MQTQLLTNLLQNKDAVIIGSLGTISYDLTNIEHPNKILIRGAMGSVLGIALGYALNTDKKVICIIGDGSFIMKMGFLATYMKYKPKNLEIHIMNNGCFKSCGTQQTNFDKVSKLLYKVPNLYIHTLDTIS